jgi:hypothetical protein
MSDEKDAPPRLRPEAGAPILSDVRAPFVFRRCCTTFLGGLRLCIPESAPISVYAVQLALFIGPLIVPIVMSLLDVHVAIRAAVAGGNAMRSS